MDTIVTLQGRKQLAMGKMKIKYVSFTDGATFYKADIVSGSQDASQRIYFETCMLPQDQISLEANDQGRLQPFANKNGIQVKDGQFVSYSFSATSSSIYTGSKQSSTLQKGDTFASTADTLLASAVNNFQKLYVIGSQDKLFEVDGFGVGNQNVEFTINNDRPITDPNQFSAHINHLESLFNDVRLSNVKNFKFLPPVNRITDQSVDKTDHRETSDRHLGHYKPWGRSHIFGLSADQIEHELLHFERLGYSRTITFEPTSKNNRLLAQFFEVNYNTMKKLDVIDYGWATPTSSTPKHYFFVGKVMTDETGSHTFIHMFTMVFG